MQASIIHAPPSSHHRSHGVFPSGSSDSMNRSPTSSSTKVICNPLEVARFISGGFVPMNELCEKAGMSERQIFDRSKAVFEYFNLPFDAEMKG